MRSGWVRCDWYVHVRQRRRLSRGWLLSRGSSRFVLPPRAPPAPRARGFLSTTSSDLLVLAHPQERRMPQAIVRRPFGECHLHDEARLDPRGLRARAARPSPASAARRPSTARPSTRRAASRRSRCRLCRRSGARRRRPRPRGAASRSRDSMASRDSSRRRSSSCSLIALIFSHSFERRGS